MLDICENRHKGNTESLENNVGAEDSRTERRRKMYEFAAKAGEQGITTDEISEAWGIPPNQVSPRLSELKMSGDLVPTKDKRGTRAGRFARVLVTKEVWEKINCSLP